MDPDIELAIEDTEQMPQPSMEKPTPRQKRKDGKPIEFSARVLELAARYDAGMPLFTEDELFQGSDFAMPRLSDIGLRVLEGCNRSDSWD